MIYTKFLAKNFLFLNTTLSKSFFFFQEYTVSEKIAKSLELFQTAFRNDNLKEVKRLLEEGWPVTLGIIEEALLKENYDIMTELLRYFAVFVRKSGREEYREKFSGRILQILLDLHRWKALKRAFQKGFYPTGEPLDVPDNAPQDIQLLCNLANIATKNNKNFEMITEMLKKRLDISFLSLPCLSPVQIVSLSMLQADIGYTQNEIINTLDKLSICFSNENYNIWQFKVEANFLNNLYKKNLNFLTNYIKVNSGMDASFLALPYLSPIQKVSESILQSGAECKQEDIINSLEQLSSCFFKKGVNIWQFKVEEQFLEKLYNKNLVTLWNYIKTNATIYDRLQDMNMYGISMAKNSDEIRKYVYKLMQKAHGCNAEALSSGGEYLELLINKLKKDFKDFKSEVESISQKKMFCEQLCSQTACTNSPAVALSPLSPNCSLSSPRSPVMSRLGR